MSHCLKDSRMEIEMKIAMVFDGLQIGGIERVGADYAHILTKLGHTVTIFNLCPSQREMESEFPDGSKIVYCKYPRKIAPEQYTQLIKKQNIFKIIYPFIWCVLEIVNVFYKLICKSQEDLRGRYDIVIAFSGHFNDLTFVKNKYVKAKKNMCWLHGALYSYLLISDGYLNLYKKIKNLVVLVDDAQEEVLCYNPNLNLKIHKLYNPTFIKEKNIDLNIVNQLKERYGKFMVMISRFEYPHKDHYTVIKALDIVRNRYGEDINLVFVGTGPDEENVKKFVENFDNGTAQHIFFAGNQKQVQNFYGAAYMLVHASIAGEGLPTVMIEALAYGLPMVVTDSKTGPREILGNDEYGLLCRVNDPEDMAQKIYKLVQDEKLYEYYKNRGRDRLTAFEPNTIQRQLKEILEDLI